MTNDLCIIIQGPSSNVEELKNAWFGYDIIWSTWIGENHKYSNNDVVIYNEIPSELGTGNINLQKISTVNGVIKAKEMGYKRVFKWRSDMIPTNPKKLLSNLKKNINFLFFHNTLPDRPGYYVDYVFESSVDDMLLIWSFDNLYSSHAEEIITSNIIKQKINNINLFGGSLDEDNDIVWIKKNINIKDYKNYKEFEY